jgi:hypothetical protein
MTISLTCACGARLEIDETFAGQTVHCPDCQRPLTTPRPERAGVLTSGFALASLTLALVGAFTLLGTVLAVAFGVLALRDIARRPEQVTGKGYAVAGIALGLLLTAITGFALTSTELFGLSNLPARMHWAGKLDYDGPEEIIRSREGFAIKRPSPKWGVKKSDRNDDAPVWEDLLLVNVELDAHLLCYAETVDEKMTLDECLKRVEDGFRDKDRAGIFGDARSPGRRGRTERISTKPLPPLGTAEIAEMLVEKSMAGQDRRFLIRVIKSPGERTAYVLIGGARQSRFARAEPEIRKALDSFRMVDGARPQGF